MPVTSRTHAIKPSTIGAIILRDGSTCAYCLRRVEFRADRLAEEGALRGLFDHVVPRCDGGKGNAANVVVCCYSCNVEKGDGPVPEDAGEEVRRRLATPIDRAAGRELGDELYPWAKAQRARGRAYQEERRERMKVLASGLEGTRFPFGALAEVA